MYSGNYYSAVDAVTDLIFRKDPQFFSKTVFGEKNALSPKQLKFFEKFIANDHITFKDGVGFSRCEGCSHEKDCMNGRPPFDRLVVCGNY